MILFDSSHLKIEYKNVPCRHLVTSWLGLPVSTIFQEGVNTILKCCEENDVRKLLSDIRYQEQISEEDEQFAHDAICRHAERHGVLHQAVVMSNEVFLTFNANDFDRCFEEKHHVRQFFPNEREAVAWLQEVDFNNYKPQ
jgi:hypothetical protein